MEKGKPSIIREEINGTALVPSIIHFTKAGEIIVGNAAKEFLITDPANTIFSVKRLMGKSYADIQAFKNNFGYQIIDEDTDRLVKIRVGDKFYSPIELSAYILTELKNRAESFLNAEVSKVVITVPAYFNDTQRQATRDAGKLAGLDVLRIVNEPTAASLVYGLGDPEAPTQKVAVYDLGGGTFDISILEIGSGIYEVLSTNGDTFLGGDDFDRAIIDFWLAQNIFTETDLAQNKNLGQTIRLSAEKAKRSLSEKDIFTQELEGMNLTISRKQFENAIQPLISKTIELCHNALKDASLTANDIDAIVLVGGSTRVPLVKEAVNDLFKDANKQTADTLFKDYINPDETVALGAAIQADILAGNNKDALLLDITPLSLGIETVGDLMDVILPRNSKIPTKVGREYTTSVDGQTKLKVAIYQGERNLVRDNRKLGEFILTGIPPMPAGLPKLEIGFIIDADGILQVSAKEKRSGVEQTIEIRSQYGISESEMGKMLIDSVRNAKEDMHIKALLEAKNEANQILYATDKFINQNLAIFSKKEIEQLLAHKDALKNAVESEEKDAINVQIQTLNDFSSPLAQRAMDKTILSAMKGTKIE